MNDIAYNETSGRRRYSALGNGALRLKRREQVDMLCAYCVYMCAIAPLEGSDSGVNPWRICRAVLRERGTGHSVLCALCGGRNMKHDGHFSKRGSVTADADDGPLMILLWLTCTRVSILISSVQAMVKISAEGG